MNAYGVGLGTPPAKLEREAPFGRAAPPRAPIEAVRARFGKFDLDEDNAQLLEDGQAVDLPPKPFAVLCALARRPGALVTKNALLDEVWGHRFVSESVLKTAVGKLRVALHDDARKPCIIQTVSRRGYRFIAGECVTPSAGPPAPEDAGAMTSQRALRTIGELLLAITEQPLEREGAMARLMEYIARWAPETMKNRTLSAP